MREQLKIGDKIGIVALSAPCAPHAIGAGIEEIERLGFRTQVELNPSESYGKDSNLFSSATVADRIEALSRLLIDPEVKVIMNARGAYGAVELLPHLDKVLLKKHPKCLIGFSDTTYLLPLWYELGIPAIHGAMASGAFAQAGTSAAARASVTALVALLKGEITNPFLKKKFNNLSLVGSGSGKILGGNLTSFVGLLGTPWEPNTEGTILCIEEKATKPYNVLRMLTQLKYAGKFSKIGGILFGTFSDCVHTSGPTVEQVCRSLFSDVSYPVLWDLPFGHSDMNLPLPIGGKATIHENMVDISF